MLKINHNCLEFVIEEDLPDVGVYLRVYKDGKCIQDFLQNNIKTCIDIASEDYGVPINLWDKSSR